MVLRCTRDKTVPQPYVGCEHMLLACHLSRGHGQQDPETACILHIEDSIGALHEVVGIY